MTDRTAQTVWHALTKPGDDREITVEESVAMFVRRVRDGPETCSTSDIIGSLALRQPPRSTR